MFHLEMSVYKLTICKMSGEFINDNTPIKGPVLMHTYDLAGIVASVETIYCSHIRILFVLVGC